MAESLFAKTKFQGFLFAGAVILVIAALNKTGASQGVINSVVTIAISAMVLFTIALLINAFRPGTAEPGVDVPAESPEEPAVWPTPDDIAMARGFMLLGVLIYMGYYFLDQIVVSSDAAVQTLLVVRTAVSVVVLAIWALSFTAWFQPRYVMIVTGAICLAGVGVGIMMYVAGPLVHFYYEGFIQVIAFAAFAFRIPPKPLALVCALMLSIYTGLAVSQFWVTGTGLVLSQEQQAVLINNLVSLVTFVVLALTASIALAKSLSPSPAAVKGDSSD